jgi:protein SCO1/2
MPQARQSAPRATLAILAAAAVAAILAGCSGGSSTAPPAGGVATGGTSGSPFYGAALPPGVRAPGFTLSDQSGRRVSLADHRGQVVVISFLYTTCGADCVLVAQQIRGALDQLAHPPSVLLISAEPAADTPAKVARFLAQASLTARVEYLSGTRGQVERALRSYRIAPPSPAGFRPPASVILVDRAGEQRVEFGLEQLTPETLAHDIGKLQAG